ncbi:conserved hypothetical protein [Aspergillus fumigatus A1163]|uniref:Uncharacterized protein n=1 Tax=Aspergillus fumigatus (strain CBS 144.89 / FGSC A1163 / CEA10) TaxID=451804 RepID=B0Y4H5_ASPFC|nr:conserved hypothetical protein [Aspergillus fumigatus A1163]
MIQLPTGPTRQLGDYHIAITQEVNIEAHLRDIAWENTRNFSHRCYFQRCTNYDDQVHFITVVMKQTTAELVGQVLAKECNNTCVGLNVVDVLSIISQQLPLILQELDEGMSGQHNDILRLLEQPDGIVNCIVLRKFRPPREFARNPNRKKRMIRFVRGPF